jgi:hypothetical protein
MEKRMRTKKQENKIVVGGKSIEVEALIIPATIVGLSVSKVLDIYQLQQQYKSWELDAFMANPPAKSTTYKVKRAIQLLNIEL